MKTVTKYILASSLIAILTITLFGVYSLNHYHAHEVREEHGRREACIKTFWQLLSDKGTDFRIVDGKLMAGTYPVNGNFELPDKVQEICGGVATVFMGDERVSTNVLNAEGKRALGTRLEGPAYEAVFKLGKSYRGEAAILGVPYLTAYDPIRDRTGKIIGVLFVGGKKSESLSSLTDLKTHLTLTLSGMVAVYLVFMVLLGRAMKRAEDAVVFQNILLSTQQDASIDGILVVDENTKILSYNSRFVEIMAIPSQLLEAREDEPVLKYVTGRMVDPQVFLEKVRYLYEHRQVCSRDEIVLRDGKTLDRYSVPLLSADGSYYGRLWSFRDITEHRRAEQEKSRLEAQLHHACMLESLMVRLGHDLRTPLTPLCILLPLIRERVADTGLEKMLDICCKNTITIKELTDKTGMLVKLSSGIKPYELEHIQLSSAVNECLAACSEMLAGEHSCCINEIDPALVVRVVPSQIKELFANLISNAVCYSPENGVIRIVAEQCAESVMVSVIDDGIGLAPAHLELVFDEFFKVDESRHDLEASGLGLSICKRIVQNHHGRIWAESAGLGQGTSVHFTLDRQFNGIPHGEKERAANG